MLTPKSRQFVMQRSQQFCRSGKYKIPTSKVINKSTGSLGIFDYEEEEIVFPLRHRSERAYCSEEDTSSTFSAPSSIQGLDNFLKKNDEDFGDLKNFYDEKVKHHRLDVRLKQMMLNNYEDNDDIFSSDLNSENSILTNKEKNLSFLNSSFCNIDNANFPLYSPQENFLEEIAAKAISDDDYCYINTSSNEEDVIDDKKQTPKLPEVLMGLGPSTSKQNFFTIATAGAITPDICHFYIPPKVKTDKSASKTNSYGLMATLFESSAKNSSTSNDQNNDSINISIISDSINNSNSYCNFNNENEMVYVSAQQEDEESSIELSPFSLLDLSNENDDILDNSEEGKANQNLKFKQETVSSKNDSSAQTTININSTESIEFVLSNNNAVEEQEVPIINSWEDLDEELVTKMTDKVINNIFDDINKIIFRLN